MAKAKTISTGETWPIEKLQPWEQNPRSISKKDFKRLQAQIKKLGVYKPLIVTKEGIVLGGNMRFRALQELGVKQVWVSVVEAPTDELKLEYALSDNDRAGEYDELKLAELVSAMPIEAALYGVDLGKATALKDLPSLGSGEIQVPTGERSGFQQMTFTLSDAQAEIVNQAINSAKHGLGIAEAEGKVEGENENSNGNALAAIAEHYNGQNQS